MMEQGIDFDIAIVDYGLRAQSAKEVAYAEDLAKRYKKRCFIKKAPISPPNIEAKARAIRYAFFEKIIHEHKYDNLITAHHLGDQLEWFLMQLAKGAGLVEMVGMEPIVKKDGYNLIRPLLFTMKEELTRYLEKKSIHYFVDETNLSEEFTRNYIRHQFSEPFLKRFASGVKKSFHYLLEDKKLLQKSLEFRDIDGILVAKKPKTPYEIKRLLDKMFKAKGYLLTSSQKEEMLRQKEGVIASRIAFAITSRCIYVAPFVKTKLDKRQKERLRRFKISAILRPFVALKGVDPQKLVCRA